MKILKAVIVIPCLLFWAFLLYKGFLFNRDCGSHLGRAASASTIQTSKSELDIGLKYAEDHNMTSGFTSAITETPGDDIGYWYNNLKAARNQLDLISDSSSQLEKSNVLMRLREIVVNSKGEVRLPNGIKRYPHNLLLGTFMWITGIILILWICSWGIKDE